MYPQIHVLLSNLPWFTEISFFIIYKYGVSYKLPKHYENTPMQHTAIFHARKNDNFHLIFFDYFLIFAQNIDCGYTLEPPQWGGSNEYQQSVF